jgi:hypothetical protein
MFEKIYLFDDKDERLLLTDRVTAQSTRTSHRELDPFSPATSTQLHSTQNSIQEVSIAKIMSDNLMAA